MLKLKLQYFGHLMQRTDSFEKPQMLGKIEGGRRRGQQKKRWLDTPVFLPGKSHPWGCQRVRHSLTTKQQQHGKFPQVELLFCKAYVGNYYLCFFTEAVILKLFKVVVDCTHIFGQQLKEWGNSSSYEVDIQSQHSTQNSFRVEICHLWQVEVSGGAWWMPSRSIS